MDVKSGESLRKRVRRPAPFLEQGASHPSRNAISPQFRQVRDQAFTRGEAPVAFRPRKKPGKRASFVAGRGD
jgi:hypothetical protein